MRYTKQFPAKNEDGLVALLVVGIMIILLSLTTVAFTKLMGRESTQALDRALSTQAYYAAQSGINDAKDYLSNHPGSGLSGSSCDTLAQKGYPPYLGPPADGDVNKVTCVTADTTPQQLSFQIPDGESRIFEMSSTSAFGKLLFSWDNVNAPAIPYNQNNYPPDAGGGLIGFNTYDKWNNINTKAPVLEVTYYPIPDVAQDLPTLLSRGRTIFLYPARNVPAPFGVNYYSSGTDNGKVVTDNCGMATNLAFYNVFKDATAVYHCNTIVSPTLSPQVPTGVGGGLQINPKQIFVKVSSYYSTAKLIVRAVDASGGEGKTIPIQNAQAVLDSTGKGGPDVLKRLQTIVDYRPIDIEPGDSLETVAGLCKRLEFNLTTGQPQVDDPSPDADTSPACHTSDL